MKKRRVTLSLDEDVVAALEAIEARSLSAAANDALRHAISGEAHRSALLDWLEELDQSHGRPTKADLARADELIDEIDPGQSGAVGAA